MHLPILPWGRQPFEEHLHCKVGCKLHIAGQSSYPFLSQKKPLNGIEVPYNLLHLSPTGFDYKPPQIPPCISEKCFLGSTV